MGCLAVVAAIVTVGGGTVVVVVVVVVVTGGGTTGGGVVTVVVTGGGTVVVVVTGGGALVVVVTGGGAVLVEVGGGTTVVLVTGGGALVVVVTGGGAWVVVVVGGGGADVVVVVGGGGGGCVVVVGGGGGADVVVVGWLTPQISIPGPGCCPGGASGPATTTERICASANSSPIDTVSLPVCAMIAFSSTKIGFCPVWITSAGPGLLTNLQTYQLFASPVGTRRQHRQAEHRGGDREGYRKQDLLHRSSLSLENESGGRKPDFAQP